MILKTKEQLMKSVAKRWKRQYYRNGDWGGIAGEVGSEETYKQLLKAKTKYSVDNIIGNNSWSSFYCHECEADDVDIAVVFNHEDDYHSHTVCRKCLLEAIGMTCVKD